MRPLSVGELLDAAFAAVRRNFRPLMVCVLVVVTPVAILQTLTLSSVTDHAFDFGRATTFDTQTTGAQLAANGVTYLLLAVAQMLAPAACLRLIGGEIVNAPASAGESLRFALSRLRSLALVLLLYVLAILGGLVLCLVGAIWTYYLFALAVPALLFEDARGRRAMGRSRQLIEGRFWRTAGTLFMMALIAGIVRGVLTGALEGIILVNSSNEAVNALLVTIATIIGYTVALPLQAAVTAYVYFDLRVRKEGFDLALLAQRIGAPAPAFTESGLPAPDAPPVGGGGFLPPEPPTGA
jgi:hypothetical protein